MSDVEPEVEQIKLKEGRPRFAGQFWSGQHVDGYAVDELEAENEALRARIEELEKKK